MSRLVWLELNSDGVRVVSGLVFDKFEYYINKFRCYFVFNRKVGKVCDE